MTDTDHEQDTARPPLRHRLGNAAFLALMRLAMAMPYEKRIPAVGWFFSRIVAPVIGWRKRIRDNLALARPDLSEAEIRDIVHEVPDNAGRALAETYSGAEFTGRVAAQDTLYGPGLPYLEEAAQSGRAVILASAHFGNYDAFRAALHAKGWPIGGLYRPMNNEAFNEHYVPAIKAIAEPLFPRGRSGLAAMLRYIKGGGWLAIAIDQYDNRGADLRFFDLPTKTVLSAAELAIRYNAYLIPIEAIREPNGLDFRVLVGAPIEHGDPAEMMQQLNDQLEALVRDHMGQWLWVHRRWKQRKAR